MKTASAKFTILFPLTIILVAALALNVQPVNAGETIYISVTGEVIGTDRIQRDKDTYTFLDSIFNKSIVVERDNIVVDGEDYALGGEGNGTGIDISHRDGVTLRNIHFLRFETGILLNWSTNNILCDNSFTNNSWSMALHNSWNNQIFNNQIQTFRRGVTLDSSSGNNIHSNVLVGGGWWDGGVYGVLLYRSNINSVYNNTITRIMEVGGITLWKSSSNYIYGNDISEGHGIWLWESNGNLMTRNTVKADSWYLGLELSNSSSKLYHNNFIMNRDRIWVGYDSVNLWDNGVEGNYWSNCTSVDSEPDGIGDTPYVIDANNTDHHPMMGAFSGYDTPYSYSVNIISNSSVSNFDFALTGSYEAVLTFNVTGEPATQGFCRICIPKALISGSHAVKLNGEVITYPQVRELPCSNDTHKHLYISYTHSQHIIEIGGTTTIPEFSSATILLLFMFIAIVVATLTKRKPNKDVTEAI